MTSNHLDEKGTNSPASVYYLGSYLKDYPRHRIIQRGLRNKGIEVFEKIDRGFLPNRWLRFSEVLRSIKNNPVIVGEASNFLTPVIIESWLRKNPVIFDAFVTLKDHFEDIEAGPKSRFLGSMLQIIDRMNNSFAGGVLVDTLQTKQYLIEDFGLEPSKGYVAYVGAETDLFTPRNPVFFENDPLRVLFYGSFHLIHGIDILLRAASIVQQRRKGIQFQIIGNGPLKKSMIELANELKLKNTTLKLDSVPYSSLPDIISQADLCLGIFGNWPKTQRVIPTKVYQCAAVGVPVITADTCAIHEGFNAGEVVLVDPGSPEALAEAIFKLADDRVLRTKTGIAGMKAVQDRFNPDRIADQVLNALQN